MKETKFSKLLNEFLIQIKKDFSITTKDLTKELDFSKNTLINWRKGNSKPTFELLDKFYKFLKNFKKNYNIKVSLNRETLTVFEQLMEEIDSQLIVYMQKESMECDIRIQKSLDINRRKTFHKNFSNFIEFLTTVSKSYNQEYATEESDYLILNGNQKREFFDTLQSLKLIGFDLDTDEKNAIQKRLAKLIGVSEAQISRWKSGKDYPSQANLKQIGKLFNPEIDAPFSSYTFDLSRFQSIFIDTPKYSNVLLEFERTYFKHIKELIKRWGKTERLEANIIKFRHLIKYDYENNNFYEDFEEIKRIFFRDCLMLFYKSFTYSNNDEEFQNWIHKQIISEEVESYKCVSSVNFELKSKEDFKNIAKEIDYGFKQLDNFINYGATFDNVRDYVLKNNDLLLFMKIQIESKDNVAVEKIFENAKDKFDSEGFIRQQCRNLCNGLSVRKEDNSIDILEAFYNQFWDLIIYKVSQPNFDLRPADKIYGKNLTSIWKTLEIDYKMLSEELHRIFEEVSEMNEKISDKAIFELVQYIKDGEKIFEEVLFNNSYFMFTKQYNESDGEFDKLKEITRLYNTVKEFQKMYPSYIF